MLLRSIFSKRTARSAIPHVPEGARVYAIGDIHGRFDLLTRMLKKISDDIAMSGSSDVTLVFLGDYIDRGPQSREVIERLVSLKGSLQERLVALKGNHEDAFLAFLDDPGHGPAWAEHGGRDTLLSYGVEAPRRRTDTAGWMQAREALLGAAPQTHVDFLRALQLSVTIGDYMFVHAGVRPGVPLDEQEERDLLWIRGEFLAHPKPFGKVIVHGHTPVDAPDISDRRIGIDTGAYATGLLTALRLEGETASLLQTDD